MQQDAAWRNRCQHFVWWLTLVVGVTWVGWWLVGYDLLDRPAFQVGAQQAPDSPPVAKPKAGDGMAVPAGKKPALSDAERIARITRAMESDRKRLADLNKRLSDPMGEFIVAETEFKTLDSDLADKEKRVKKLLEMGKSAETAVLQEELKLIREQWQIARDRFNLAIQEQRILKKKCAALEEKLVQDQRLLDAASGKMSPTPPVNQNGMPGPGPAEARAAEEKPAAPRPADKTAGTKTMVPPPTAVPGTPMAALAATGPPTAEAGGVEKPAAPVNKATEKELQEARTRAKSRHDAADLASQELETVQARLQTIQKYIDLESELVETARKKADQARAARQKLEEDLQRRLMENPAGIEEVEARIAEAQKRADVAATDLQASQERREELQRYLQYLQDQQNNLTRDAARKQQEADAADRTVLDLENPYTVRNLLQWLLDQGPRVLLVLGIMLLLSRGIALGSRRLVKVMTGSSKRGTLEERENRAQTLASVFRNAATVAIIGGGTTTLLDTLGIPIVPLMGGAAVVGLAVAFGAQNLIRDYFAGFMVLLENQYGINDVIKVSDIAGKVEKITLRMTVLRDQQGVVHFIPHGTITKVSNMTHGFSVALFDIGVSYRQDIDHTMRVLMELARELRRDPVFGPRILDEPEMLGVDSFSDSAVVIKFLLKTRPLHQWAIRRELLRRIKNRFDQLGIEIPFPHRTVYHRTENGAALSPEHLEDITNGAHAA